MFTPRSILALLIVGQIAAYSVGEISGGVMSGLLKPLGRMLGMDGVTLRIGPMDVGHFLETVVSSLVMLVVGILVLVPLIRFGWPWLSKALRLESGDSSAK